MASHATAVKVQQLPVPKIVVFGLDDDSRPHAAWFGKPKAEAAKAAARQLGFNVAEATNGLAAVGTSICGRSVLGKSNRATSFSSLSNRNSSARPFVVECL